MKLPLPTAIGLALPVATAGLAIASPEPPPIYLMANPESGESWVLNGPNDGWGARSEQPEETYNSLDGIDIDGDNANFAAEYESLSTNMTDDYEMWSQATSLQTLVEHSFRAGFGGSGLADGRLEVTFYDLNDVEVGSYFVNLTGAEGFNTYVISFTQAVPLEPSGSVKFDWIGSPDNRRFGLMEAEPQLGFNGNKLLDGVNPVDPPGNAYPGISQKFVTMDIPAPGSLAPLVLACMGCTYRRRRC